MDSIDNIGNVPSYSSAKGVSAYNGINNIVNQLNRDNPNSFENQFLGKSKETFNGEIIDLKSNEITVRLDNGSSVTAQIYDTSSLSIGQTIKFHLQNTKGVLVLEPVEISGNTATSLITKALEAANLPISDKNIDVANELLKNNMSLDSNSINEIVQQSNLYKSVSISNLVLMNKHNIPVNNETTVEFDKYINYEHRIIKEIDSIAMDFPEIIDNVIKNDTQIDKVLDFNTKLVNILSKPNTIIDSANSESTNNDFTTSDIQNNIIQNINEHNLESVLHTVEDSVINTDAKIINNAFSRGLKAYANTNINTIINNTSSSPTPSVNYNAIGRGIENPEVAVAYLTPSSASEILTILEPYNIPKDIISGIQDGTAPLRDVADTIKKALEIADEIDDYRVSSYNQGTQGSPIQYGTISANAARNMDYIDSMTSPEDLPTSTQTGSETTLSDVKQKANSTDYVNVPLAKDAFQHPVIQNILDKYEILQRDNSEIASFSNFYNRGQLTSLLRDIPNSDSVANQVWKGNISANELLLQINDLIADGDADVVKKLLTSDQYKTIVKEAILNNWTISANSLRKENAVSETYERIYEEIRDLQNLVQTYANNSDSSSQVTKEFTGIKNNIDFMNTLNNMFSYVQLPLKLREQNVHSDLYVLTNKQKLKQDKSNLNVLLHLDMNYLGTLDININLTGNLVNTKFQVTDDFTKELLEKNMEQLEYAMLEKGFVLSSSVALKERDVSLLNDFLEKDTPTTSIKRYSFDMRT